MFKERLEQLQCLPRLFSYSNNLTERNPNKKKQNYIQYGWWSFAWARVFFIFILRLSNPLQSFSNSQNIENHSHVHWVRLALLCRSSTLYYQTSWSSRYTCTRLLICMYVCVLFFYTFFVCFNFTLSTLQLIVFVCI